MSDIAKTVVHSTAQISLALVSGSLIDYVFPDPGVDTGSDDVLAFLRNSAEVVLQTSANALLAALVMKTIRSMEKGGAGDPAEGFAFFAASLAAQPKWLAKVDRLSRYVQGRLVATGGSIEGAVERLRGIPQTAKAPVALNYVDMGQQTPRTPYS